MDKEERILKTQESENKMISFVAVSIALAICALTYNYRACTNKQMELNSEICKEAIKSGKISEVCHVNY